MSVASLVGVPELQAEGPARVQASRQGWCEIIFLQSGATMTIEQHALMRYVLLPDTEVQLNDREESVRIQAVAAQKGAGDLVRYRCIANDKSTVDIDESLIRKVISPSDPRDQLSQVAFHDLAVTTTKTGKPRAPEAMGPKSLCARESVLAWADNLWHQSGGVLALGGARIDLLPHQILTAQRALADASVRFLLADEVGLGKTIEAGLIMQSLLAMNPNLRVLVVAPGALVSQWFLELYIKFGGRQFTMLDGDRIENAQDDPWAQQFTICSSRALEDLSPRQALRFATTEWDIVIMDECHRMQPGGILYQRMTVLSRNSPHVLLLSATPPRQHARNYLGLLHLLQPDAYPLDEVASFQAKMDLSQEISQLIRDFEDGDESAFEHAEHLLEADSALQQLLAQRDVTAVVHWLREHYVPDHRVIRHRRGALARLAQHSGVRALSLGIRTREWCTYTPDAPEQAVQDALAAYRNHLLDPYREDLSKAPPRLLHWLLQIEQAASAHPQQLYGLLAMRAAVVEDPEEFEEYRERVSSNEDLGTVLRSDGSDAEMATQVAISAASNVHDSYEIDLLEALQDCNAKWLKQTPKRLTALLKSLKSFWKSHPQEKVLVFTTHASCLRQVQEFLADKIGDDKIAEFGAHQDAESREAAATRFRTVDDCWVLVCDALGGEGRNFQFVSMVAHYDLPWSVSAVEQRVGRVDRLGRDGEVLSLVCRPDNPSAMASAWADVLDQVVDVFQRSSSGLEFVAAGIEENALNAGLSDGGEALRATIPELQEAIERERELLLADEDDGFHSDATSFISAQKCAYNLNKFPVPISGLCRWLRGMGGRAKNDDDNPGHFSLRGRGENDWTKGVFDVRKAQRFQDQAFFARGHHVIDTLVDDAATASWCGANAWRRKKQEGGTNWEGLRTSLRLNLNLVPLMEAGLPLETLRRVWMILPAPPQYLMVRIDGQLEERDDVIEVLKAPFDSYKGDRPFSNQVSRSLWMQPLVGGKNQQIMGWQERMRAVADTAASHAATWGQSYLEPAIKELDARLEQQAALLRGRLEVAQKQWGPTHHDCQRLAQELQDEERVGNCLRSVLAGAELAISTVSYIKVV